MIEKYSLDIGFNDIKFRYAFVEENIYFMLHQKCILFEEYKVSTEKDEYEFLRRKYDEL